MGFFDLFVIASMIVFYLAFLGRAAILAAREKVNPFVLGKGKTGLHRALEYLFLAGLIIWTCAVIAQAARVNVASFLKSMLSPRYSSVVLSIPGVVLITIGLVIFIMSLRDFGRSWRVGIDKDTSDKLVTAGIFSVSRNPMFLFLDMYFIGIALIYPNFFFMLSCLIVIPGLHYQILQEEKFLLSKYGEEYERYKSRVRRYI